MDDTVEKLARMHPDLVRTDAAGHTSGGRPIHRVVLTHPKYPAQNKQHVLIAAGQHGNEESARLVALRLMEFLLTPPARSILARQVIVVLPNVSPDAAETDSYETPAGIKPNLDHGPGGAVSPEGKALEAAAEALMPEVYVDLHARGHAGCSYDMVLFPPSRPYTEDEHLLHGIASMMADAGEQSGIPHVVHPLTWPGWGGPDLNQPSSTLMVYRKYKSLVFLTESAEHNQIAYASNRRARAGVNRVRALLSLGNRRHPRLYYEGYPCYCTVGMFHAGVVAIGRTAAHRRASRVSIWRQADHFQQVATAIPEPPMTKTLQVNYTGPTLSSGVGFQVRAAGRCRVKQVTIDGRRLRPGQTSGFYTWQDRYTTYAVAACPELARGQHEIVFRFE